MQIRRQLDRSLVCCVYKFEYTWMIFFPNFFVSFIVPRIFVFIYFKYQKYKNRHTVICFIFIIVLQIEW